MECCDEEGNYFKKIREQFRKIQLAERPVEARGVGVQGPAHDVDEGGGRGPDLQGGGEPDEASSESSSESDSSVDEAVRQRNRPPPAHVAAFGDRTELRSKDLFEANLEASVTRKQHVQLRNKTFESHLFEVKFHPINPQQPVIVGEILPELQQAVIKIIKRLQEHYGPGENREISFVWLHDRINKGIQAPYLLLKGDPEAKSERILDVLLHFTASYSDLKVDSSFALDVQVLSLSRTIQRQLKKGLVVPQDEAGHGGDKAAPHPYQTLGVQHKKWFLRIPRGFTTGSNQTETIFDSRCILISLIVSYYLLLDSESGTTKYFSMFRALQKPPPEDPKTEAEKRLSRNHRRCGYFLLEKCGELEKKLKEECGIRLDEGGEALPVAICSAFAILHKITVYVFDLEKGTTDGKRDTSSILHSIHPSPHSAGPIRRHIAVLRDHLEPGFQGFHFQSIMDLQAFFNFAKTAVCLSCLGNCARINRHFKKCFAAEESYCNSCERLIPSDEITERPRGNLALFCFDSQKKTVSSTFPCSKCGRKVLKGREDLGAGSCAQKHLTSVCNRGFQCPQCQVFTSRGKKESLEDVAKSHICGRRQVTCKSCFLSIEPQDENHRCLNRQIGFQQTHFGLNFANFVLFGIPEENCSDCSSAQRGQDVGFDLCSKHGNLRPTESVKVLSSSCLRNNENQPEKLLGKTFICPQGRVEEVEFSLEMRNGHLLLGNEAKSSPYLTTERKKTKFNLESRAKRICSKVVNSECPVEHFIALVLQSGVNQTYLFSSAEPMPLLMGKLVSLGLEISFFTNKSRLPYILIPSFGILFLCFSSYGDESLKEQLKGSGIEMEYFPNSLDPEDWWSWEGEYPGGSLSTEHDTPEEKKDKERLANKWRGKKWSYKKELLQFCSFNVKSLSEVATKFLGAIIIFQERLKKSSACVRRPDKKKSLEFIHPFSIEISSISKLGHTLLRAFCLNVKDFVSLPNEVPKEWNSKTKTSYGEHQYLTFVRSKNPHLQIRTEFNHARGQKTVDIGEYERATPDGYAEDHELKKILCFDFLGCLVHGHAISTECLKRANLLEKYSGYGGRSHRENFDRVMRRSEKLIISLRKSFPGYEVSHELKWECFFFREKKDNCEVKKFFSEEYKALKRPLKRLIPKLACRGNLSYPLALSSTPGFKISYVDINSQHPSVCINESFPVGEFEIFTDNDLRDRIEWTAEGCRFQFESGIFLDVQGLIFGRFLCPNLDLPFLPFKNKKTGKACLATCYKCCENREFKSCTHHEAGRSFEGCYTICEIGYAVANLGYRVLRVFEVYAYRRSLPILRGYFEMLFAERLRSACPPEEEKEAYAKRINSVLGGRAKVSPSECLCDPAYQKIAKKLLNFSIGRFAMSKEYSDSKIVHESWELSQLVNEKRRRSLSIKALNDSALLVTLQKHPERLKPDREGNVMIYAHVLARSRILLDRYCRIVERARASRLLFCNVDAMAYEMPQGSELQSLIPISQAAGAFKHVFGSGKIVSFHSLGPRVYEFVIEDENGETFRHCILHSFCLKSIQSQALLSTINFPRSIEEAFEGQNRRFGFVQKRKKSFDLMEVQKTLKKRFFTAKLADSRIVFLRNEILQTVPYGWKGPLETGAGPQVKKSKR